MAPPRIPEIRLLLADDAIGLWERTETELGTTGLPPPFWAFAWAGGQALARHILDHPHLVSGHRVLDLAAGSGLVAIAAAKAAATTVTASEIDQFAVTAMALNADANGVRIDTLRTDLLTEDPNGIDVILAGDVFYEKAMATRVLGFLERARGRGTRVLIGDPGRTYLPRHRFATLATYDIPVPATLEDTDIKRTAVAEMRPA